MPSRGRRPVTTPPLPAGVREVRERREDAPVPAARHPDWSERFDWLVQGTTTRGPDGSPWDLALFGAAPPPRARDRWTALTRAEGMERVVHGRQVHGASVRLHRDGPPGLHVVPATDGHATPTPGVLLAVTVADCVPVFLVEPELPAVAVLHAGWRGAAAGVLEAGLEVLARDLGAGPESIHVHLGPAICGSCYEVGPEVHEALGLPPPPGPRPVDLRCVLAARATAAGVDSRRVSVSTWCTKCGDSPFFSHRAGDAARQVAYAGIRP